MVGWVAGCRGDELGNQVVGQLARRHRLVRPFFLFFLLGLNVPPFSLLSDVAHYADSQLSPSFSLFYSEYPGKHVTHILAHQPLSASKNHSFLTKHKGWKPQIVDPQWVDECVQKGKRVDVFKFLILSPCVSLSSSSLVRFSPLALSRPKS